VNHIFNYDYQEKNGASTYNFIPFLLSFDELLQLYSQHNVAR